MGREKEPFQGRRHSQEERKRGRDEDEYNLYEDDPEYEEYDEDDEFEVDDDFGEMGSNARRRRPAPPLPPFPARNRHTYPPRLRVRHMPESPSPRPPIRPTHMTHSKRQAYLPDEPQPPGRRSTGSYQRPAQQRTRIRSDIPPSSPSLGRRVPARPPKRSVWPIFLGGCAAGAVSLVLALAIIVWIGVHSVQNDLNGHSNGKLIPEEPNTQTFSLSALSQLIVCDAAGNISVSVDPNPATANAVVKTTKIAHTDDPNAANQIFNQTSVSATAQQPSGQPLTCEQLQANPPPASNPALTATPAATNNSVLSVNIIFPSNQAGQTATVDVVITLPQSVVSSQDPTRTFTSTLISLRDGQGTINIDGVSGKMDVQDSSGDITVKNDILVDGSRLQAQEGKLTFNGLISSTVLSSNKRANIFFSGASLIDLTLPETNPVMIDATANAPTAKITSDFSIKATTNTNGSSTYQGPFNPTVATDENTVPWVTLQSSSGNISMHKAKR